MQLPSSVQLYNVNVSYFSVIRRCFFFFQSNPKNQDPSYKTDLDLWDRKEGLNSYYSKISKGLFVVIIERGKPRLVAE